MVKQSGRIQSLQALRAIAFLEIFLGHCGILFFTGAFGVSIFIVLSGFCMAINYLPKINNMKISAWENIKYAVSKVKKLYGLHLFMLFWAFLLARMPVSGGAGRRMLLDVLLLQSWSPDAADYFSYNGVAWYLSVYFFILIMAPCLMKLLSGMKSKKAVGAVMLTGYIMMVAIGAFVTWKTIPIGDNFAFWFTYISPVYRLLEFFVGAALGWLYLHGDRKMPSSNFGMTVLEILGVAMFVVVICIFHKMEGRYDGLCYTALFTPVSMLLVWLFACSKGLAVKFFSNKMFLWLGNLSSHTFLVHQVVIRWLVTLLNQEKLGNAYIFVLTILSFAVTVIGVEIILFINKKTGGSHGKRISGIRNI